MEEKEGVKNKILEEIAKLDLGEGLRVGEMRRNIKQLAHIVGMPSNTRQDVWRIWASITNDCHFQWTDTSFKNNHKVRKSSMNTHLFLTGTERHPPASPRLRLMHLLSTIDSEIGDQHLDSLIVRLIKEDFGLKAEVPVSVTYRQRRSAVTNFQLEPVLHVEGDANMVNQIDIDMEERFSGEIATSRGRIWWRQHEIVLPGQFQDTIVMNDLALPTSSALSPNKFAQIDFQVTMTTPVVDITRARCTCSQAKYIHCSLNASQQAVGIDGCVHVKFLQKRVAPVYQFVFEGSEMEEGVLLHKLRDATGTICRPVELLSPPVLLERKNVEFVKYSVVGKEAVAVVSVSFLKPASNPTCITRCPHTQCRGIRTKAVVAEPDLHDVPVDECCEHIRTLWQSGRVQMDFEWCFGPQDARLVEETANAPEEVAASKPEQVKDKFFDKERNLWIFNSFVGVDGYSPCEDLTDPLLVK